LRRSSSSRDSAEQSLSLYHDKVTLFELRKNAADIWEPIDKKQDLEISSSCRMKKAQAY